MERQCERMEGNVRYTRQGSQINVYTYYIHDAFILMADLSESHFFVTLYSVCTCHKFYYNNNINNTINIVNNY